MSTTTPTPSPRAAPSAPAPEPVDRRITREVLRDLGRERTARRRVPLPKGNLGPSLRNTLAVTTAPLEMLLEHERRLGPVFTLRLAHQAVVWGIGAEANHDILVKQADAFGWRESRFGDLWPLLGDSFFAIDGPYHQQSRRMLLPAFHAKTVGGLAQGILDEAVEGAAQLQPGTRVDINGWVRELAMRIALRVLAGIGTDSDVERRFAHAFERALAFHGRPLPLQMLRGPRTPYADMRRARAELDGLVRDEIDRRRAADDPGPGVLGMLVAATDEAGRPLPPGLVRDHLMTLLFAGHDTTTATFSFLAHEVGRNTGVRDELLAELDSELVDGVPTARQLDGTALPVLERVLSEALRRYPAAWVGPRRTLRDVEVAGVEIPAGMAVHYSSWATHHLEELYPQPMAFRPDRFLPGGEVDALPKGAYVPFGGGSRICLGKRFAEYELRAIVATVLSRVLLDPDPADPLRLSFTPTLGPKGGLRMAVRPR
ncbi:cytochrome P450 [Patulibacter sp.]|uniref:cytochrome P450 n=1 Tax=Patulibacter sp. TaxID=1912859 RepID=UPI002715C5EB|nr:cytochrome P450 [Patulibacter sp.]MDO9407419.1 cytochrome P450 [Patulibacter sp.]